MFRRIFCSVKSNVFLYSKKNLYTIDVVQARCFCGLYKNKISEKQFKRCNANNKINFKWHSSSILDGGVSEHLNKDTDSIKVFLNPRVTLNELATRVPQKLFDIQYKQTQVAPKQSKSKKKTPQNNNWICTYVFHWPNKNKFESTSTSKKQAAEKCATQAIEWLYKNGHIDKNGRPLYDSEVIEKMSSGINKPFTAELNDKSVARIDRIWTDYQEGIKDLYIKTQEEAFKRLRESSFASNEQSQNNEDVTDDECVIEDDGFFKETGNIESDNATSSTGLTPNRRDKQIARAFERRSREMAPLPIDEFSDQILSLVQSSRVTVIRGAAGCGKSTRVPALLLSCYGSQCRALVGEPRRVAAVSLARRVAEELGEEVGVSIGYLVRLGAKPPRRRDGGVLYCTSGVLLAKLRVDPGLHDYTHIFVDEAHERDVNTDLSLLLLKRALTLNDKLKVVVMSATMDVGVFTRYFDTESYIEVPGRTYPVQALYIKEIEDKFNIKLPQTREFCSNEDDTPNISYSEIVQVIKSIDSKCAEGAILVFLPGWADIKAVKAILDEAYKDSCAHIIVPVHSRLSTEEQSKMFARPLPGVRKIVLATNIAETSVTIPDVSHVVDCGVHKENTVVHTGASSLQVAWVSRAAAKQRMGRAGRVQSGYCYKMYSKENEDNFNEYTTPEILRVPLDRVALDCKSYAPEDKVQDFLKQLPEPPNEKAVMMVVNDLIEIGALTTDQILTPLGSKLTSLSLSPRIALSLLHSLVTCNVESLAFIAGGGDICSGERGDIRELKKKYSTTSDHSALYKIQDEFEREPRKQINELLRRDKLLHAKAITNLHLKQLISTIPLRNEEEIGEINRFTCIELMLSATILSGCNNLIFTKQRVSTKGRLGLSNHVYTTTSHRVHISTQSVNSHLNKASTHSALLTHSGARHSAARRAYVVDETSRISPVTALIFAQGDVYVKSTNGDGSILRIAKHNIDVTVPNNQSDAILKSREMLWKTFRFYYERDLSTLDEDTENLVFRFKMRLLKAIGRILLESENIEYVDEE